MSVHPGWPEDLGPLRVPAGVVTVRPVKLRDAAVWSRLRIRDREHLEPWEPPENRPGMLATTSPSGRPCAETFAPKRARQDPSPGDRTRREVLRAGHHRKCGARRSAVRLGGLLGRLARDRWGRSHSCRCAHTRSRILEGRSASSGGHCSAGERVESRSPTKCGVPGGRSSQALPRCRRPMA